MLDDPDDLMTEELGEFSFDPELPESNEDLEYDSDIFEDEAVNKNNPENSKPNQTSQQIPSNSPNLASPTQSNQNLDEDELADFFESEIYEFSQDLEYQAEIFDGVFLDKDTLQNSSTSQISHQIPSNSPNLTSPTQSNQNSSHIAFKINRNPLINDVPSASPYLTSQIQSHQEDLMEEIEMFDVEMFDYDFNYLRQNQQSQEDFYDTLSDQREEDGLIELERQKISQLPQPIRRLEAAEIFNFDEMIKEYRALYENLLLQQPDNLIVKQRPKKVKDQRKIDNALIELEKNPPNLRSFFQNDQLFERVLNTLLDQNQKDYLSKLKSSYIQSPENSDEKQQIWEIKVNKLKDITNLAALDAIGTALANAQKIIAYTTI